MSRRCCAVAACFAALPARKDTPRRCARRESPGDVLPTNRLRSTEPSGCASRTVRLPSDLRHGNERNGDPFRLPHPLRFFLPRLYLSVRLCDSSGPHKHSPCRSTTANSDYVLVSRYRHETTRNAPDRRARRHGHHRPRSPACPRCGACIARSRFFPEACTKLISLKSICQTFLANIKKVSTRLSGGESLSAFGRNRRPCRMRASALRRAVSTERRSRGRKWRRRNEVPFERR